MQELQFQEDIDPHAIDHTVIAAVLEFVYELFAPKVESKVVKREKRVYIDPASFAMGKPIEQSQNLLEMFLLAAGRAFGGVLRHGHPDDASRVVASCSALYVSMIAPV